VTILLTIIYVLVCLFLILVVLLQQGKGADLAGAFGGGGSSTSFGPRSATNIMHRLTTISFVLFVVLSMTLVILSGLRRASVMESLPAPEAAVEVQTGADDSVIGPGEAEPTDDATAAPAEAPETTQVDAPVDAAPESSETEQPQ
jgi:preprotein translocase subunit SecG